MVPILIYFHLEVDTTLVEKIESWLSPGLRFHFALRDDRAALAGQRDEWFRQLR